MKVSCALLFRVPVPRPECDRHLAGVFWLMTDYMTGYDKLKDKTPCDELDIIEAYGGEGPGSPNADDTYMITPWK